MAERNRRTFLTGLIGFLGFMVLVRFIRYPEKFRRLLEEIWPSFGKNDVPTEKSQSRKFRIYGDKNIQPMESPKEILSELPKTIGAFVAEKELESYPIAGLGVSLGYNTPDNIAATIYIYNMEMKSIPDGIDSKIIKYAYKQATDEIKHFENVGVYQNVKIIYNEPTDIGSYRFLCAVLNFDIYDTNDNKEIKILPFRTEIYMTGKLNHIVKLRVTYPAEKRNYIRSQIDELLENIFYFF